MDVNFNVKSIDVNNNILRADQRENSAIGHRLGGKTQADLDFDGVEVNFEISSGNEDT